MYWWVFKINVKNSVWREKREVISALQLHWERPWLQGTPRWRCDRQAMPPSLPALHCPVGTPGTSLSWTAASTPAPFSIQLIYVRGCLACSWFALQGEHLQSWEWGKLDCAFCSLICNPQYFLSTFSSTSVLIIRNSQKPQNPLLNSNLGLGRKLCQLWLSSLLSWLTGSMVTAVITRDEIACTVITPQSSVWDGLWDTHCRFSQLQTGYGEHSTSVLIMFFII